MPISCSERPAARPRIIGLHVAHARTAISPNKMGMTVEEADESVFWLTFVGGSGLKENDDQRELLGEAKELLAIFTKSAKTASDNDNQQ